MAASSQPESTGLGQKVASTPSMSSIQQDTTDAGGTAQGQTDADNFQQYATALRSQGQPEKTVRELTASRITAAFQSRRAAIRNQTRQGIAGGASVQAQLDMLNRAQGSLIVQLFGAEENPTDATEDTASAEAARTGDGKQALMPAVMAEAMPATVTTGEQASEWEKLRHDFVNAIGGASEDPAHPRYRQRWMQAQSAADQRFRLLFGDTAYVQHQMQAQRESMMKDQGLGR